MTPSELPFRLIPKRQPHPALSAAITVSAIAVALAIRYAVLGRNGGATSSTLFPAMIIIAIYAGGRWALSATAFVVVLAVGFYIDRAMHGGVVSWFGFVLYAGSLIATVMVAAALRELVIRIDEEAKARTAAEEERRESEARFRTLADSAPVLLWVTNTDRTRAFVNLAYREFLGLDHEGAQTFDWRERLHPDDAERIFAEQMAGEASMAPFALEARYRRADGEWRWLRSSSRPRLDAAGKFAGFIGIAFDVSDAKRAETDLKRINELLAERVEAALSERDDAQAALMQSQKLEALGQLTGGVAHDFNNLLTVVIGALDIIQRHPEDAARRERLAGAALAAAKRGERLTQQLLAFSRRQPLKPEVLGVDTLLRQCEPLLHRAAGETCEFLVRLGAPDTLALVDGSQLEAAVLNLVINARDAIGEGGRIAISTDVVTQAVPDGELPAGDYCAVDVADNGEGMDAETAAHAFEPFFTTKSVGKGTGLGLSQVYGFGRQSGGVVRIRSVVGEGTTVRILLPTATAISPRAPDAKTPSLSQRRLKVLLVEDDAEVGELVEAMLRELGHEVIRAADAAEGLSAAETHRDLGLMLTDVIMPGGKNGVQLAREITGLYPSLPVILSSGYTGETLADAEGAPWPLLRKPYTLEDLAAVVERTVGSNQAASDTPKKSA